MRAHYLQHVPFEGLANIAPWLEQAGYRLTGTRLYLEESLPDPAEPDLLVVMGGPMGVHDYGMYPWLREEKRFIAAVLERGIPVLGVCLGAQLIASALGAAVVPAASKEIGWFPIRNQAPAQPGIFRFAAEQTVFHWHGDTFALPEGATLLASSEACSHQAFQWGERVIGLQFHLETTAQSAASLVKHCRHELQPAAFVQPEEIILAAPEAHYQGLQDTLQQVLAFISRT